MCRRVEDKVTSIYLRKRNAYEKKRKSVIYVFDNDMYVLGDVMSV